MNKQDLNTGNNEVVAIDYDMEEEERRIQNPNGLMGTEPVGHKRINSFVAQDTAQVI